MGNRDQWGMQTVAAVPAIPPKKIGRPDVLQSAKWYEDAKNTYKENTLFNECQLRHKTLINLLDSVEEKRRKLDPTKTSKAHSVEVNRTIDRALQAIEQPLKANLAFGYGAVDKVNQQINDQTRLEEDTRSAEVRATLRSMQPAARREILTKAIEEKDTAVLGSALNGSALLSGLTAAQQQSYRDRYILTHAKDLNELKTVTSKAAETLEKASFAMIEHLEKLRVDPDNEEIRSSEYANAAFESQLANVKTTVV